MGIFLKSEKVKKKWTDYNGHMNVAYYTHIFDTAADIVLNKFQMAGKSAEEDKKSTFVVESHTTYNQEVKFGDDIEVYLTYLNYDKKRIQYKASMFHKEKKYLAATIEVLSLYVDLNQRKVAEFESKKIKLMADFIKENSSKFNSEKLIFSDKLKK